MSTVHVVLGSTGGAGHAIAAALFDAGLPVRAVSRCGHADLPAGITQLAADITTSDIAAAVADAAVVYMAAQPQYHRWPQEFPAMLDRVVDATAAVGAKLVMVDNLYAYGPCDHPMTPATPQRATDAKGHLRAAMADRLLQAHREGRLRVAIGRASDYFGPGADNSTITALAIEPIAKGGSLRWMCALDKPHAVAYLPDIARAYVRLGTDPRADGRVWILPHAPAPTGEEFLALVNAALPDPRKTSVVSKTMLRLAAPFHRISNEVLGISYQWTQSYTLADSAFRTELGPFEVTPLDEAVKATVAAYHARV